MGKAIIDNVVRFSCEEDLSKYVDSMLFDSGEDIAAIEYQVGEYSVMLYLVVSGAVRVIYRGDTYTYPSEFPTVLKELFRNGLAYESTNVYIEDGNWFSFKYSISCNGEELDYDDVPYESEINLLSTEELKQEMAEFAHQLILEEIKMHNKVDFPEIEVGKEYFYMFYPESSSNLSLSLVEVVEINRDKHIADLRFKEVYVDQSGNGFFTHLKQTEGKMWGSCKYLYNCPFKKEFVPPDETVLLDKKNLLEQISYIKAAHPDAETSDYFRGFHAGIDLVIGYIESQSGQKIEK